MTDTQTGHTDWLKSLCTADVKRACVDLPIQSNGMAAFRNIPTFLYLQWRTVRDKKDKHTLHPPMHSFVLQNGNPNSGYMSQLIWNRAESIR